MKDKICTICGVEIKNAYGKTKYCTTCREIARLENLQIWREKQKKTPQTIKCAICGKEVQRTCSNSKYCVDCRVEANKEKRVVYQRSAYGTFKGEKQPPTVPKSPVVTKPIATRKTLQGEYRGQAFYPLVAVKQPKTAFTYSQIKQLADASGVSYAKQAEAMGI